MLALLAASGAQARSALTVHCMPTSKTSCTVVISAAGGLPDQPFTVIFPGKGYALSESGGTPAGKVDWELGPPADVPSDYRDGDTRYVSQIDAAASNAPGTKIIITFMLRSALSPSGGQAPAAGPTVTAGIYSGTCGADASGKANACQVSFSLSAGGRRIVNLRFEPPACLLNNDTETSLPVGAGGSFNVTITFDHGTPKFTISGQILSASKATATISASCSGKTTTRTLTLHGHG